MKNSKNLKIILNNFLNFSIRVFVLMSTIGSLGLSYSLQFTQPRCVILLNWMAEVPEQKPYFLRSDFKHTLREIKPYSSTVYKLLIGHCITVFILVLIVQILFQYFINGETYFVPLHFEIPLLPKDNLFIYLINLTQQAYMVFAMVSIISFFDFFMINTILNVIIYLDATKLLMSNMMMGIEEGNFQKWLKTVSTDIRNIKTYELLFLILKQ